MAPIIDFEAKSDRDLLVQIAQAMNTLANEVQTLRDWKHETNNLMQGYQFGIETNKNALNDAVAVQQKCEETHDAETACIQRELRAMKVSRAQYWGIVTGIAIGAGGSGASLFAVLAKALGG